MPVQTYMLNEALTGRKRLLWGIFICTIGALFYCYEFVLRIIPGVLQSELCAAFGNISAATFGQLSAFYYFAYSPMQMPVGMLMDRYGPRRLLTFACLCCTLGSLMFSYSASLLVAGGGRFLVGLGSSFAFVGVLSLAFQWLPRRYFSLVAGLVTTLGMLGIIYGEVKITQMTEYMGLNDVLMTVVIIGAVLTAFIFLVVRDAPIEHPIKSQPLPDFFRSVGKVLVSPQVWVIGFVGALLYTSLSVFGELWGKNYLEQAHHLGKVDAAKAMSFLFLGWAVGAPIAGYLSDLFRKRVLPLVVGAILSCVFICIILYAPGLSFYSLCTCLFLYGLFSGTELVVFIMAKESSGAELAGTVFAVTNMIITLGGVVFQPLVGKLLDTFGDVGLMNGEHIYTVLDYQIALSILPICLLLVILVAFFLKDQP